MAISKPMNPQVAEVGRDPLYELEGAHGGSRNSPHEVARKATPTYEELSVHMSALIE